MYKILKKQIKNIIKTVLKYLFKIESIEGHLIIHSFSNSPTVIDLGAGEGEFSDIFLNYYPDSKMILIEANPYSVSKLFLKYKNNGGIFVINAAISSTPKLEEKFTIQKERYASSLKNLCSMESISQKRCTEDITIKTTTVEQIIQQLNLKKVDLLKIDIEGEEINVIDSLTVDRLNFINQITVEFHDFLIPSLLPKVELCIKKLKGSGYSFIHRKTKMKFGSDYYNCLFYKESCLKLSALIKWFKIL